MIQLSIKGSKKSAARAASRRGIAIKQCSKARHNTVICKAPCRDLSKAMYWYGEHGSRTKEGRGFVPGTLLFFSNRGCEGLGRARKRRRR